MLLNCKRYGCTNIYETELSSTHHKLSKRVWKKRLKLAVKEVENSEWIATTLLYKGFSTFLQLNIDICSGFKWWQWVKMYPQYLFKIKVMLRLIIINNVKAGFECNCGIEPNVYHILFHCVKNDYNRDLLWNNVLLSMPSALRVQVIAMSDKEKVKFLYSVAPLNIPEWDGANIELVNFCLSPSKNMVF